MAAEVRRVRIAKDFSQNQLATASGLSQPTIINIERGANVTIESLIRVSLALECPLDELIREARESLELLTNNS